MGRWMRIRSWGAAVACALFAASLPASAAAKTTTGELSKRGYTVIALTGSGGAASTEANKGDFRLRTGKGTLTLHLRAPNGKYVGPVVVGQDGNHAIVGVEAGADLGRVKVRDGYAKVSGKLPQETVDESRTAGSRNGAPLGARGYGRVRASTPRNAPPGDPDFDGIPNTFDIDDDGDLVLDNLDRSREARAAGQGEGFGFELTLNAELPQTLNANATGVSTAQIDQLLIFNGRLLVGAPENAEIDCGRPQSRADPTLGGLVYCTRGGTGRVVPPPGPPQPPPEDWLRFPGDCDPDDDGLGSFGGNCRDFLAHGATSAQIGTGDVMVAHLQGGGEVAATLQYVPVTVQALVSYNDGQGNSATVSYPVPGPTGDRALPSAGNTARGRGRHRTRSRSGPARMGTWS